MGNLIVLILAENLQLLYFIYKTLHSLGKRFCEYYGGKKKLQHMAGSSLLPCIALARVLWAGPPPSTPSEAGSIWRALLRPLHDFPSMRTFPCNLLNAWLSTCQSKGASLTSSSVPHPSLLTPGSDNSDRCVCLPRSVAISPFLSISISRPVPRFSISLCFFCR